MVAAHELCFPRRGLSSPCPRASGLPLPPRRDHPGSGAMTRAKVQVSFRGSDSRRPGLWGHRHCLASVEERLPPWLHLHRTSTEGGESPIDLDPLRSRSLTDRTWGDT